jgi:hypothetical protein
MNGKNCSICVYQDGMRADGTFRCCTSERQRDVTVVDCCVPEKPLRQLQDQTKDAHTYIAVTQQYVEKVKSQSAYWQKSTNKNGQ